MNIEVTLKDGLLPDKYAKYSEFKIGGAPSMSFPIKIKGVPQGAKTLALTFVDFDSIPVCGFAWKHWLTANLPTDIDEIRENASLDGAFGMIQGKTDFSGAISCRYGGPCPPDRMHNYTLTLFALNCSLELSKGFSLDELNAKINGHILEKAEIILHARS